MVKNALVINPWVTDFKLYDEWMHPIGLYFLISLLEHNSWNISYLNCLGYEARKKKRKFSTGLFHSYTIDKPELYVDIPRKYKLYGISEESFISQIQSFEKPDVIFIGSSMTFWIQGLEKTITLVQSLFPQTPIIVGGISATLIPSILEKRFPGISMFSGSLLDNLSQFQQSHDLLRNFTDKGWLPSMKPSFQYIDNLYHGPLVTSFGCPYSCTYCASSHLHLNYAFRDISIIIDEIESLIDNFAVKDFAFFDDALLFRYKSNFFSVIKAITSIENSTRLRLHVPNGLHARWINEEVLTVMKESGFTTLRIGYESSSEKHTRETGGKNKDVELPKTIECMKNAGFQAGDIGVYVMAGLPNQSLSDVLHDIDFITSLGVKVKPVFLSPVPKTRLFDYYASMVPSIKEDPLCHNDLFFITKIEGWHYADVEYIREKVRICNEKLNPC